jgi:uncharacterized protein YndB with AHSA1/START domain
MPMNESLTTQDGRHILRMERHLAHAVDKVWRAITDPRELSAWWPLAIDEIQLQVGASLRFHDEQGNVLFGVVSELQPGRVIAFRESTDAGEHEVRCELVADGVGCRLVFSHAFPVGTAEPAEHAAGWYACLAALGALLAGEPLLPIRVDPEIRRHYEVVLGTAL